jgi:hypothetical protein
MYGIGIQYSVVESKKRATTNDMTKTGTPTNTLKVHKIVHIDLRVLVLPHKQFPKHPHLQLLDVVRHHNFRDGPVEAVCR